MPIFRRTPKASQSDLEQLRVEMSALRSELTKRTNDLALVTGAANALDQKIAALDSRVTRMTSELSNQLHELGNDIASLADRDDESAVENTITELRANQTRIANEQARYEIAFRQDLAEIAEMIRRLR
jgi:predicted transcriptional regulator